MAWFGGDASEQGLNSMNFMSVGMLPWMQQRFYPSTLRTDLSQQYQAMLAAGMHNFGGGGDLLKHQLMHFQQPAHYMGGHNPLPQQQGPVSSHILPAQAQMPPENIQRQLQQQINSQPGEHNYQEAFLVQQDRLQQRQPSDVPSSSFTKSEFTNLSSNLSASNTHPSMQNLLGSLCPEGSDNLLHYPRAGQSMHNGQSSQQSWVRNCSNSTSLPPYPGNEASNELGTCNLDLQNHALFGSSVDSSGLRLPTTVSAVVTSSVHTNMPSLPLEAASEYQSPPYGYVQDSSDVLHGTGQVDQPNRIFVKVVLICLVYFQGKMIIFHM